MAKLLFAEQAIDDLEDIFAYTIETFGEAQAEKYKAALNSGFKRISDDPRLGRPMTGHTRTFFQYTCESHAIFYSKEEDAVFIVRVLHVAMDFLRHLPE